MTVDINIRKREIIKKRANTKTGIDYRFIWAGLIAGCVGCTFIDLQHIQRMCVSGVCKDCPPPLLRFQCLADSLPPDTARLHGQSCSAQQLPAEPILSVCCCKCSTRLTRHQIKKPVDVVQYAQTLDSTQLRYKNLTSMEGGIVSLTYKPGGG